MRKHFSKYIEDIADKHDDIVFVTGDLGYNALENLVEKLGERFINAGVAEQNMIGVAAGMAYKGYRVLCYSIAPFAVYRCLEQIRNDVCFHNLPVYVVGNGGGYGYGIMGSSHHCIEDIACLSGLPNMRCYVPAFVEDMNACMDEMFERRGPAYLRLGLGKSLPTSHQLTNYGAAPSAINSKARLTVLAQGPVSVNAFDGIKLSGYTHLIDVFVVNRMPLQHLPEDIIASIRSTNNVLVIEEHIATGGLGQSVASAALNKGLNINKFNSLKAEGYPDGLYGSQAYHQGRSGLDAESISRTINDYF
jgi:transketolase